MTELLLKAGAAPVSAAISLAARYGHLGIVTALLASGASVSDSGDALVLASISGHLEIVKMLLSAGANVNAEGDTFSAVCQILRSFRRFICGMLAYT
jgi:ankyrin repeat protein